MMSVGGNTIFQKLGTFFVVKNIAPNNKRIRIFQYPINNGQTRDILAIPGVSEADIRHSLLKGELLVKLQHHEITIVESDIDLLQFNDVQKSFLQSAGITKGLEATFGSMTTTQHETLRQLIHLADGVGGGFEGFNNTFREILPTADPFPTTITWWDSAFKLKKIIEKSLSYDVSKRIISVVWTVYDNTGVLLATVTDTISYSGSSPFESTRIRTMS